jgi:hypothetical protein
MHNASQFLTNVKKMKSVAAVLVLASSAAAFSTGPSARVETRLSESKVKTVPNVSLQWSSFKQYDLTSPSCVL